MSYFALNQQWLKLLTQCCTLLFFYNNLAAKKSIHCHLEQVYIFLLRVFFLNFMLRYKPKN